MQKSKNVVDSIFEKEQNTPIPEAQESHRLAVIRRGKAYTEYAKLKPQFLRAEAELEKSKEAEAKAMSFLTSCICVQRER